MRFLLTLFAIMAILSQAALAREIIDAAHVRDMPADKAILIYERVDQGRLAASVVTKDGVRRVTLAADEIVVERLAGRLLDSLNPEHLAITSPGDFPEFDAQAAHRLFRLLVRPLMNELGEIGRLAIAADSALAALPFDTLLTALPRPELQDARAYRHYPWLRKTFAISRLTRSVRPVSGAAAARRSEGGLLGFGNPAIGQGWGPLPPALPEANLELAMLRMSLHGRPGEIAVGERASEARLKKALASADHLSVLALATHGTRVKGAGDEAVLMLSHGDGDDGMLTADEVRALSFRADLVILSACHSGASTLVDAFIEAGGDRVLALRWPVLSDVARKVSTSVVAMTQRTPDLPHDLALWQAVNRLISDGKSSHYDHPMVWAPFVLTSAAA